MERHASVYTHPAYLNALRFEHQYSLTSRLGLARDLFSDLTRLYLTDYVLKDEAANFKKALENPGVQFWKNYFPNIYQRVYGAQISEAQRCQLVIPQVERQTTRVYIDMDSKNIPYAQKLKDAVKAMTQDGIIQHQGYRLQISRENVRRIPEYRIDRIPTT